MKNYKDYLNCKVKYDREGSRAGWVGKIIFITGSRVTIEYLDHNVVQDYQLSALRLPSDSKSDDPLTFVGYLKVLTANSTDANDLQTIAPHRITKSSHLVINIQTGQIVGVLDSHEEAEFFAREQAEDNIKRQAFTVFSATSTFAIKQPIVEKLVSLLKS